MRFHLAEGNLEGQATHSLAVLPGQDGVRSPVSVRPTFDAGVIVIDGELPETRDPLAGLNHEDSGHDLAGHVSGVDKGGVVPRLGQQYRLVVLPKEKYGTGTVHPGSRVVGSIFYTKGGQTSLMFDFHSLCITEEDWPEVKEAVDAMRSLWCEYKSLNHIE